MKMGQQVHHDDCRTVLQTMATASIDAVVTSPPYNLGKKYSVHDDNMPEWEYLKFMGDVAHELRRVLKPAGHVFLNVGWNSKAPWRSIDVASTYRKHFELQNVICWVKSLALDASTMPDNLATMAPMQAWLKEHGLPTKGSTARSLCEAMRTSLHERTFGHFPSLGAASVFLNPGWEDVWHLTPTGRSPVDRLAIGVPYVWADQPKRFGHGRDRHCRGNVWHIPYKTTQSRDDRFQHPSPYPRELVTMCLKLAALGPDAAVLDPFVGTGSTLLAAKAMGLRAIGIDVDPAYCDAAREQLRRQPDPCTV